MALNVEELRNSLGQYYLAINSGYQWYDYQQNTIIPALEDLERREILRLAIFMPPGESKSDIATRTFVPWYLGKHSDHNAMVCSYSADLASDDFGAKIKARMQGDLHLKIFPNSRLTQDSRSKTHFTTKMGGNFYSVGYSGGIGGKRLDLLVMDDLIKDWVDAESETIQNTLFDTYTGLLKDRLKPKAVIVMCAHRWTQRDIYARILEHDGTVDQGGDWFVITLPAEDPQNPGKYLWEEYHGRKHYEDFKKKEGKVWWAKFQQDPSASQAYKFKEEWLKFYDIPISPDRYNTYMIVDPAGAKGKKSDYTSIHVWAAGQDKKLFLVDWIHDRLNPKERVDAIMRLTRQWKQQQTIYEEYGLLSDTYYLTEKMQEEGFDTRVYPVPVGRSGPRHNLSKDLRIDAIVPFFSEGRIYLPRKCPRKIYDGCTIDLTKRFIDEEYKLFKGVGSIPHEDDLDAMSRLLEPELVITYMENEENIGRKRSVGGQKIAGSWEAVY